MQQVQKLFKKAGKALRRFFGRVRKGSAIDIAILVAAAVLAAALIAILVLKIAQGTAGTAASGTSKAASVLAQGNEGYDKNAAAIDKNKYDGTILPETADAGESYVNDTLFVGDSNTARMIVYGAATLQNDIGVVGMGIQHVLSTPCIYFAGYSDPVYVTKAIELMQPRRIIITYGTNNANWDTATFKTQYRKALKAIHDAYPYASIIINAVPPVAQQRSYPEITMKAVDSFNLALVELAREDGYQFLDSSEALKDEATGYARDGYTVSDGIHLSETGMDALMKYIRTHPYETADTRPARKKVPTHQATPETLFVPAASSSETSSSSSSSSSSAAGVTVTFSVQGDAAGGTLSGATTQTVAPGGTCSTVTLALNGDYTFVWGCTEGSIANHNSAASVSFTVPASTKSSSISVWVTLTKKAVSSSSSSAASSSSSAVSSSSAAPSASSSTASSSAASSPSSSSSSSSSSASSPVASSAAPPASAASTASAST